MAREKARTAALLAAPEEVEAQFYEALQQGDIAKLMAVWADDDEVVCVHPGGPRLIGAAAIRASFEAIFANGAIPVQPDKVHRVHSLSCAVHHLLERVAVTGTDGPGTAFVIATNVFLKTAQGWRMVAHHASPGSEHEPLDIGEPPSTLH